MSVSIKDLSFAYGPKQIFSHFSLYIRPGERLWLSAKSGFGKTTLLRLICGLENPDSGEVAVKEGAKISAVFQEDRLLPWLNVEKNIALVLRHLPKEEAQDRITRCLEAVGLATEAKSYPASLSGGMARRAALARALAADWDILLLDEPFVGIDTDMKEQIARFIDGEAKGKTIVLVTHDATEAALISAERFELDDRAL